MTIRSELEIPLIMFGKERNIPVALEGVTFTKPTDAPYLRIWFLDKDIYNPTVEFSRKRTRGVVQIDVCYPEKGQGSAAIELLAEQVAALYPAADKEAFETISIEQHPQIGRALPEGTFRIIPISIAYRQES